MEPPDRKRLAAEYNILYWQHLRHDRKVIERLEEELVEELRLRAFNRWRE